MPDPSLLSPRQRRVFDVARKLGTLRARVEALRSGARRTLVAERDAYAFTRTTAGGSTVVVLVSKGNAPTAIVFAPGAVPPGGYVDAIDHTELRAESDAPTSVTMEPLSFRILTPK
jgi:hypothetical protein